VNLDAWRRPEGILDRAVQQELPADKTGGHDHPGAEAGEQSTEAGLARKRGKATRHRALRAVPAVDLREERVRGLREDRGGEAGDDAGPEADPELGRGRERRPRLGRHGPVRELVAPLMHSELPDCVGDLPVSGNQLHAGRNGRQLRLLAENGQESRVQATHAFLAGEPRKAGREAARVPPLRHEPDAGRLQRREENVCEELGNRARAEVDRGAVPGRALLRAEDVDERLLPVLVPSEFGAALDEVANLEQDSIR
jgi:hypothetical protein